MSKKAVWLGCLVLAALAVLLGWGQGRVAADCADLTIGVDHGQGLVDCNACKVEETGTVYNGDDITNLVCVSVGISASYAFADPTITWSGEQGQCVNVGSHQTKHWKVDGVKSPWTASVSWACVYISYPCNDPDDEYAYAIWSGTCPDC